VVGMDDRTDPTEHINESRSQHRTKATLYGLIFVLSLGEGGARFLAPVYLAENGSTVGSIGLSLSAFGVASLVSRFFIGSISRASTVRRTIACSATASAIALVVITTTTSTAAFTILIGIHGAGWGVLATVLLTLVISGNKRGKAASVIGFYVGVEGLGRAGAPALAGLIGGSIGPAGGIRVMTIIFAVAAFIGVALVRDSPQRAKSNDAGTSIRMGLGRFRFVPLAAWVAALTGFYLNTTNAVLNTFFPLLGISLGFTLTQVGALAGSRSLISALIRFVASKAFDRISFRVQLIPLFALNAISASLIGTVVVFPLQFLLWMPNGASRGVLRVGSMAEATEDSNEDNASSTAALIGAGYDGGRIVGPALGGIVASWVGLSAMFVTMPIFFVSLIVPLALWARRGSETKPETA